jgi:hypothetical protein
MHRFSWDLRYAGIATAAGSNEIPDDDDATGAVPHRTYVLANAPWAAPGTYTVRLTVDGKTYTQPLTLRLDPRVKTPSAALGQLATLSRELYEGAVAAHRAFVQARALSTQLAALEGPDVAAFKATIDSVAPGAPRTGRGGRGRAAAGVAATPSLETASTALLAAAMAMQRADVAPTAAQIAAASRARADAAAVMARWTTIKTTGLATFNNRRKAGGAAPLTLPKDG